MNTCESIFRARLARHERELKALYTSLYHNDAMYDALLDGMLDFCIQRSEALHARDEEKALRPDWYKSRDLLGMMLYIDNFAGNLQGVRDKLDYLRKANVNYLHLMPFLDTVPERSDGGYAVASFRRVRPDLGTMEDLEALTAACHEQGMNVCMDFVMNHTSEDHEWAKRARAGEGQYMNRYFFYADPSVPAAYEKTVPQVFPTTAPGNFTWLPESGHYVMTTFYPYQWDLNYANPVVFNEMMYNFLYLANRGVDVIRIDAVPYIWKEIGTTCRNLPQVHTIVRMMRMIGEIVCPSVILLGEVVMAPELVAPYFGTLEQPECHLLYNVTTMATTWHTVATRDVRLLRMQLDIISRLPKDQVFLNYLRCHDDIGWGLDYPTLHKWGMEEVPHKKYLNDYFRGFTGSDARGELYNEDPVTGDARLCGTTASLCGVEAAADKTQAIRLDLMLHAMMLFQSGIPVLYSGDEIGQLNDWAYRQDPNKVQDSRYLHRGRMPWPMTESAADERTVPGQIFMGLDHLERLRRAHKAFGAQADFWTFDTQSDHVLGIGRYHDGELLIGLFNFSDAPASAQPDIPNEAYTDLLTGDNVLAGALSLEACGMKLLVHHYA
ncbi:MAG: amylosucrase [Clostridia bacterium]|nr:amylosucrase [Clostridia bacterium]